MTIRVLERGVQNADGEDLVGVRRDLFGTDLTVTWLCGDKRKFTQADIVSLTQCVEALAPYDDVWLQSADAEGRDFYLQLSADELHADNQPGGVRQRRGVNWIELKKVLAKAVK